MKKRYEVIPIVMLAVLALAVFSMPQALADPCICDVATHGCPCACGTNGTVDGTVYVGGGRPPDDGNSYSENHVLQEFSVPDGTIIWSRLYAHVWGGNAGNDGTIRLTYCNANGNCFENSIYCPPVSAGPNVCSQDETEGFYQGGCGTHWSYWNVTPYTTAGYNNATVHTNEGGVTWDGRSMWIVLVTVVEIDGYPQTYYWVNQGYEDLEAAHTSTTWFYGDILQTDSTLWHLAVTADGEQRIWFNGHLAGDYNFPTWMDVEVLEIPGAWIELDGDQNMMWDNIADPWAHPVMSILINNNVYFGMADLQVTEKVIDQLTGACSGQTPTGFVVNHGYDVKAKVTNDGGAATGSNFDVTLYDDGVPVQTNNMAALAEGDSRWTTFQWTPTTSGNHELRIMADSGTTILELDETNNNHTQTEQVLPAGSPDLYAYPCCIDFKPRWQQPNKTDIIVDVLNDGTGDANNFNVELTMLKNGAPLWTGTQSTSVCAKAKKEITFEPPHDLENCSDYTVTVELDSGYTVGESNEGNNIETKTFHAVEVTMKVTHHYGNWSDYNGQLSDYNTAQMFETTKVIANYTTPITLLESEADVTSGVNNYPYVWGINRSVNQGTSTWYLNESGSETETCVIGQGIWWFLHVNGIPTQNMPYWMDKYNFKAGDIMQMDLKKYINAGDTANHFRPRSIMGYPNPFKNGFDGVEWDTTIVYPSADPSYAALASAIQSSLNSAGANVNNKTTAAVTTAEKQNNHLILLGTQFNNNLIDELNDHHAEVGMPVYFNATNWMVDDWLNNCQDATFDWGGVVEACDNPYNNAEPWENTWYDESQTIWIASGVDEANAKNAAELLANHSYRFNKKFFWGYTINFTVYEGKNLISTPFEMDEETGTDTLDWVFEDNPANWDKVLRYIPGPDGRYKTAYYYGGEWYGNVDEVEPIEPGVGYEYQRTVGDGDFNLILGCRLPPGGVSTTIYEGKNLISYACLRTTNLSTFDTPAAWDKVLRYIPGPDGRYKTAYYYGGEWYGNVDEVEPIEPGVGYEYQRSVGAGAFDWTYIC